MKKLHNQITQPKFNQKFIINVHLNSNFLKMAPCNATQMINAFYLLMNLLELYKNQQALENKSLLKIFFSFTPLAKILKIFIPASTYYITPT